MKNKELKNLSGRALIEHVENLDQEQYNALSEENKQLYYNAEDAVFWESYAMRAEY